MEAVIIDDERLSTFLLQKMLAEFNCFTKISTFENGEDVLNFIRANHVDVAFVDIEMPGISGVNLAVEMRRIHKSIKIIFITAHTNYAVQAFEIEALDYVVKPFTPERIENTVKRIAGGLSVHREQGEKKQMLHCLGELRVTKQHGNSPILLNKWRTKKAKALFCYFIHNRNQTIHKDVLIELFWNDVSLEKAHTNLHTTIYQIRKMIQSYAIPFEIVRVGDGYRSEMKNIVLDMDIFEEKIRQLPELTSETLTAYESVIALYENDYFYDSYYAWAESERVRLQSIWMRFAFSLIAFYIEMNRYEQVINLCFLIQKIDPLEEKSYISLIEIYSKTGNTAGAKKQIEKLHAIQEEINLP
ncbi:response regulator [Niallia sp. 01092]|uniref:response regulator n=1 Tax=unclassified Niallia TaxID=2837522 RepID=UPI003FD51AAA